MASEGRMVSTSTTATPAPGVFPPPAQPTFSLRAPTTCNPPSPVLTSPRFLLPFARSCRHVTPSGSRLLPTFKGHCLALGKEPFFLRCHPSDPTTLNPVPLPALLLDPFNRLRRPSLEPHWQSYCHGISAAKWPPDLMPS